MSKFLSGTLAGIAIAVFVFPVAVFMGAFSLVYHHGDNITDEDTPMAGFLWVCRGTAWIVAGLVALAAAVGGVFVNHHFTLSVIVGGLILWLILRTDARPVGVRR